MTPRLKFFIFSKKFKLFLLFFKAKVYFKTIKSEHLFYYSAFDKFLPYFYHTYYFKLFKNLSFNLTGFYLNNLTKSYVFWCAYQSLKFIFASTPSKTIFFWSWNTAIDYQYEQPVTLLSSALNQNSFKNFLYFKFFFLNITWYQHNFHLHFYLNFLFLINELFLLPIFSGYFFKIYRF